MPPTPHPSAKSHPDLCEVEFFGKVGSGEAVGYGWTGIPTEPPGARERFRKAREAKARAEASHHHPQSRHRLRSLLKPFSR